MVFRTGEVDGNDREVRPLRKLRLEQATYEGAVDVHVVILRPLVKAAQIQDHWERVVWFTDGVNGIPAESTSLVEPAVFG